MATATGTIVGTPAYMSPEQYRSSRVDEFADQFSFCAALYEALYSERPYPGVTLEEIRTQVAAGHIQEPSPERRVFPAVHAALLRGLADDPARRWPSLAALLDYLERYDPDQDPSQARRQQRSFTQLLDVTMLVVGGVMLSLSSKDPDALTPVSLIVPVVAVLLISGVYMWILREHLVAHRFHWLMLRILLMLLLACLLGRVLGAVAGDDSAGVLLLGLLGAGSVAVTIALFVAPVIWGIALVQLSGAVLIAANLGPITAIDVLAQTASVLLYTRAWRLSATSDNLRVTTSHPSMSSAAMTRPTSSAAAVMVDASRGPDQRTR